MMAMMVGSPILWRRFYLKRSTQILLKLTQLVSAQKEISNGMWRSINGSRDQHFLIAEVRILKSLRASQILEPGKQTKFQDLETREAPLIFETSDLRTSEY